jgi:S-formylglutathione hydrolase FrmB
VYLLHGYSGNQRAWLKDAPQLLKKADELNVLLVCPDGGFSSWYFDSPVDPSIRYETFISKELIAYIDSKYSTLADRMHRAITGLSMGGHGGLYLGIRHQDVFGLAGSICGGVDLRPFPENWDIKKRIGDTVCCKENWKNYSVISQISRLDSASLKLIIDCGTSDFFLNVNRDLHKALLEKKIPHDYTERPGGHNKDYWGNSIDFQLLFFRKNFG